MGRKLLLRLAVIGLVLFGVYYWQRSRKPTDLTVTIDLSEARPSEITGLDVVVRRNGKLLNRHEVSGFSDAGAPRSIEMVVHAPPGLAEVESTVDYAGKPSRRTLTTIDLRPDATNTVKLH